MVCRDGSEEFLFILFCVIVILDSNGVLSLICLQSSHLNSIIVNGGKMDSFRKEMSISNILDILLKRG